MHKIIDGTDSITAINPPKTFGESISSRDKIHNTEDRITPIAPIAKSSAPFRLLPKLFVVIVYIAIITTLIKRDDWINWQNRFFLVAP